MLLDRSSGKTYFKQRSLFRPSIYTLCKVSSFALFNLIFLVNGKLKTSNYDNLNWAIETTHELK